MSTEQLIPCPACLVKISRQATTCPKCGQPINPQAVAAWERRLNSVTSTRAIGSTLYVLAAIAVVFAAPAFANHAKPWDIIFAAIAFILVVAGAIVRGVAKESLKNGG